MITVRNEGHGGHFGVEQLAPLLKFEGGAVVGEVARHVTHGDRPLQRGRKAAAGDLADLIAFAVEDERAFANRLAAINLQADAFLWRAVLQFGENPCAPGKPPSERRRLLMAKLSPAITGVVRVSRSWP